MTIELDKTTNIIDIAELIAESVSKLLLILKLAKNINIAIIESALITITESASMVIVSYYLQAIESLLRLYLLMLEI